MAKIKVKFKVMTYGASKPSTRTLMLECPDFKEEESAISEEALEGMSEVMKELMTSPINIESQQIDWLDGMDKSDLMYENDWRVILDFEIVKPETSLQRQRRKMSVVDKVAEVIVQTVENEKDQDDKTIEDPTKLLLEFKATYDHMKESLEGLPHNRQIDITFSAMGVGMKAATTAYSNIISKLRGEDEEGAEAFRLNKGQNQIEE